MILFHPIVTLWLFRVIFSRFKIFTIFIIEFFFSFDKLLTIVLYR